MNSKIVSEPTGEQMTLFSPVGSLNYANHTPLQESDLEKKMTDTSGQKCLDAFGRLSRAGSWAKTFSELLIGTGDWYSTRCRLTWKLKGTKYKRLFFQLAPSTPRTEETGSGLWPTSQATERHRTDVAEQMREEGKPLYYRRTKDGKARQFSPLDYAVYKGLLLTPTTREEVQDLEKFKARMEKYPNGTTMPNLATQVVGLLPTPQARDEKNGSKLEDGRTQRKIEQGWSMGLNDLSTMGLLPTPAQSNHHNGTKKERPKGQPSRRSELNHLIAQETGQTSLQLNPQFVGEMMGFPADWTELPFLNGETNQSKPTETP